MTEFNKFTKEAKRALIIAQEKAKNSKLSYVGTEHLLMGILAQENSLGASILLNFGVSIDNVNLVLKTVGHVNPGATDGQSSSGLSGFAKSVIEDAVKVAHEFGHAFVGTEHLLFSLVSQENTAATVILENMKVSPYDVKEQILEIFERAKDISTKGSTAEATLPKNPQMVNPLEFFLNGLQGVMGSQPQNEKSYKKKGESGNGGGSATPALDYFTTNLVDEAKQGKIDRVIGRDLEIDRLISILSRKTKNNPVLIGESGVGKTAVCEGLALAIANDMVPENMLDKKILSLSMASVVAGTKYRGEFEERIKQIIEEATSQDNVILFIDEIHTIMGAGSAEGSLDAANILKPALSRGKVQVIGATTIAEYRKNIEKDSALERRFQSVLVKEPTQAQTLEILHGIRESFEDHHNLLFSDAALDAAVTLASRYVNDRFLPDKAIDLIDEAAANKRIRTSTGTSDKVKKLQKKLASIIKRKEDCVSRQDYERAAEYRNEELLVMKDIDAAKTTKIPREKREHVGADDIADLVSKMTGVPVSKLLKNDITKLKNLELTLKKRIIGQEEAIVSVANAIRRSRAGFADERRPIGSFIFMGPTGVGKTELVRAIAEEVFDDKDALIKIDMSEFMERHNTSRLVGATAGYVGYEDGGQLTEAVRRKPYSVILFDEIEKAHPDVFNLLLQILEDGELTDAKGRKVDFSNTVIIMTSNIGAKRLTDKAAPIGFAESFDEQQQAEKDFERSKEAILEDLKKHFRPEFLNRVDKVVVFHALTHANLREIVKLNLNYLQDRLTQKSIKLDATSGALDALVLLGYDAAYGARPLRRAIQQYVEDPLTTRYLEGEFTEGDVIKLVKKGKEVDFMKSK
ncbi:ATP-dependent Clp protease ATP-binding subunit ClpC [Candidatus Peregrinibacteria bacterium HGW-Peregrinibacteria-1]|jgi:ATP-dependent Clp protease ATP-binding subunit ClpC|nr:MAG: ATP-dependent Clp protease ATP-binding subunit ClpC [Candidatus Peregrinibacteria bacterium HGW-Peregrinibacteria-1]